MWTTIGMIATLAFLAVGIAVVILNVLAFSGLTDYFHFWFRKGPTFQLNRAAAKGDLETVLKLLADGVDPNMSLALGHACKGGHLEIVNALINSGADVDVDVEEDPLAVAPLGIAAREGSVEIARALLEAGADVNAKEEWLLGETALMCAAERGHVEVVRLLLDQGADANVIWEETGGTALMFAAECGHTKIVRMLLENGADFTIADDTRKKRTALMHAERKGHAEIVQLLKDAGAEK